jgi:hypothetical protein
MLFNHTNNKKIQDVYCNDNNYKVSFNNSANSISCTIVYCSSNGIYFPNNIETFTKTIIKNNKYEWSKGRNQLKNAKKSIFIRDVYKQWYLKGVNGNINNIDKLVSFIEKENTEDSLVVVGVSSGGYIATLIGSKLNADIVLNFSGQFEINSVLCKGGDRIVNEEKSNWGEYYNLDSLVSATTASIFYFSCENSFSDREHIKFSKKHLTIKSFIFDCDFHDVPFPKMLLGRLLSLNVNELLNLHEEVYKFNKKSINPEIFWRNLMRPSHYYFYNILYFIVNLYKLPRYIARHVVKKLK